ncbi:MAG: F0F1 ATP synthase subunit delta [Patescibacteria group bacterium]
MYSDILDSIKTKADLDILLEQIDIDRLKKGRQELDKLKQAALAMPVVRLTLAFEPPGNWILEIRNWVGKAVVLDMAVDKSILGGAIVENRGKYGDYSLRKMIYNLKFEI